MASPRRYLTLLQTLADLDSKTLGIILPHMEQSVREVIYTAVANVVYHSKDKLSPEIRGELSTLLSEHRKDLEKLAKKNVAKLEKRRMLRSLSNEIQVILHAVIPMLIMSAPVKRV